MSHVLVGFKSNLDWNLKLHVTPTWYIPYCKQIFIYSHATFHFIMLPAEMHFLQFNRIEPQGTSPQRHHNWTLQATSCLNAIYQDFSLLYIFTFLCFFASPSSTMPPPCLAKKSSCIHLFRTSNIAWPSTLNCTKLPSPPQVYISPPLSSTSSSPVYPCVVVISIFSVLQLTPIFNTRSHPCSLIAFIMFSCFSAFNFTLCPPSIISTRFLNEGVYCNHKVKLKIHCKLHCEENGRMDCAKKNA